MSEYANSTDIRQKHAEVVPSLLLDTAASSEPSVDVLLTPASVSNVARVLDKNPRSDWDEFLLTQPGVIEEAIARRALLDLDIIELCHGQVAGEVDNSKEIALAEEKRYPHFRDSLFRAALKRKYEMLEQCEVPGELLPAKALLLDELAVMIQGGEVDVLVVPGQRTLEVLGAWLDTQYSDALELLGEDQKRMLGATEIAEVFRHAIASTPALVNNGWTVQVIEREKTAISVDAKQRRILIPSQRRASARIVSKLMIHEVFGHAMRSANAEEAGDHVGTIGTAHYEEFEESFMLALEQCLEVRYDKTKGINLYIAAGLALTEKKSKDEITRILKSASLLLKSSSSPLDAAAIESTDRFISSHISRMFTGMTDVDEGIIHRKDINYLHGLNDAWQLLNYIVENDCVDAGMRWLYAAKFNPFIEAERQHVNSFHPMPQVLKNFFTDVTYSQVA